MRRVVAAHAGRVALLLTLVLGLRGGVLAGGGSAGDVQMEVSGMDEGPAAVVWGQPMDGLRLGLSSTGSVVGLHLQNVGEVQLTVLSHVAAQEVHLDWYTLHLADQHGQTRKLVLLDNRDESAPVRVQLAPGATVDHRVDVAAWATRSANGGQPLAPGTYQVSATYEVAPGRNAWSGRLEAGPVALTL